MKFIEDKKLFGKINIVDILLVVIVLAGGLCAYKKVFNNDSNVSIGAKYYTTNFMMRIQSVSPAIYDFLKADTDVYDNETNQYIGKLKSFSSGECLVDMISYTEEKYVMSKIPDKINIYLNIEVQVAERPGDLVNSSNYFIKVGKYINVRAGTFAGGGYIMEVDEIPELVKEVPEKEEGTFNYYVFIEDISESSAKALHKGDEVYDKMSNAYLGKIVDFEVVPHKRQLQILDGTTIMSEVPQKIAVTLKLNVEGGLKDGEYLAKGLTRINGGGYKTLKTDYIMCSGMIMKIEE